MKIEYGDYFKLDPDTSIRDYIQAVYLTLLHWRRVHGDPVWWAADWLSVYESPRDDPSFFLEECSKEVGNNHFSFDMAEALVKKQAEKWLDDFFYCPTCGWIVERGSECDCDGEKWEDASLEDVEGYLREIGYEGEQATWQDIIDIMEGPGFETYYDALKYLTESIIEEVGDSLRAIQGAESNADLFVACQAATAIWHVNGNIARDYGDRFGLEWNQIDSIRNKGLADWFGEEEAYDFLEGEFEELDYLDEEFDYEPEAVC